MITGIVESIGVVNDIEKCDNHFTFTFKTNLDLSDAIIGGSIAINGVCLTMTSLHDDCFTADVVQETLQKTNLSRLSTGDAVNIERMMKINARLDGHLVQGHIDTSAEVLEMTEREDGVWLHVALPELIAPYVVPKGSITLDGMSLTVVDVDHHAFSVTLIPHTLEKTISKHYTKGTMVNLEADVLAKHIHKLIGNRYE